MTGERPAGPPVNRALAARIATRLYGVAPRLRWIPSDEVDVFVATFDGAPGLPDKVLKLDRPGGRVAAQEQRLLPYLRAAGVEVPVIEHSGVEPIGDVAGAVVDTVAFTVQPFLERRGIRDVYAEDAAAARDVADRLGRSAAHLHALPVADVPGGSDAEATRYWTTRWYVRQHQRYDASPYKSERFDRVCARAMALLQRLPTHFGNGQGYQSLFDGRGTFAIIDWGTAGVYWPLYDLAQAVGAMHVWCRWEAPSEGAVVEPKAVTADLVPRVLAAYLGGRTLSEGEADELALWRAHGALMAAVGAVVAGRTEHAAVRLGIAEEVLAARPGLLAG